MSDIYSTVSIVAFILAGVSVAGAIVVFFAVNVRGAYSELRGHTDKDWVRKRRSKAADKASKAAKAVERKKNQATSRLDSSGEAVTTMENGEEAVPSALVGVYEPGTDAVDEKTEIGTVKEVIPEDVRTTAAEEIPIFDDFIITKKVVYINSEKLIFV